MSQFAHPQFDNRKAYVAQEKEGSSFVSCKVLETISVVRESDTVWSVV